MVSAAPCKPEIVALLRAKYGAVVLQSFGGPFRLRYGTGCED